MFEDTEKEDNRRKWTLDEFEEAWNEVLESEKFNREEIYRVQPTSGRTKTFHEEGYGEMLPKTFHNIALQTKLNEKKKVKSRTVPKWFLDIGSGIGNVVNLVAYTTLATCVGVEIHIARSKLASNLSMLMDEKRREKDTNEGIRSEDQRHMHISLYTGDGFLLEPAFDLFDVIFANNLLFDEAMNQRLFRMIGKRCKKGTLLVVTKLTYDKEIIEKYFTIPKFNENLAIIEGVNQMQFRVRDDIIKKSFLKFEGKGSWTSKSVPYYITKVKE